MHTYILPWDYTGMGRYFTYVYIYRFEMVPGKSDRWGGYGLPTGWEQLFVGVFLCRTIVLLRHSTIKGVDAQYHSCTERALDGLR